MEEVILCKYGEIILKGSNKHTFEQKLMKEVRRRAKKIGDFNVRYAQSMVYIEPKSDDCDMEEMYDQAKKIFGFACVTRAAVCDKTMEAILAKAKEYLPEKIKGCRNFRCEAKRSDKKFPLTSPEIAAEVGGVILENVPGIKVNLSDPDVCIRVEIRDKYAYIHSMQEKGAGGIPIGSGGRGMLLLSGGIDSPVAGYLMAKRGLIIDAVHFESIPYTSERAKEKVLELAEEMTEYCGRIKVHIISLTHIQEEIRDRCEEEYFTLILRRFMMKLAERSANENFCNALITGESLGQVASQTLAAINVTNDVVSMPVLRPCIGLDKEEIIEYSRRINTYDTSILPFEDCCTIFTPRHPRTQPEMEKVLLEESKIDVEGLLEEAWNTRYLEIVGE